MKHVNTALLLILLILTTFSTAAAWENVHEGNITKTAGSLEIPSGTAVTGDVTVNMGELIVSGLVNGNIENNMGKTVIHGDVNGNVEINMGQVFIHGNVSGDVTNNMGEIVVNGIVGGNLNAGVGSVAINGTVGGDVAVELGNLDVFGEVLGNIISNGKMLQIDGTVAGNINLTRGILELNPGAVVKGEVRIGQGLYYLAAGAEAASVTVEQELSRAEVDRLFSPGGLPNWLNLNLGPFSSIIRNNSMKNFFDRLPFLAARHRLETRLINLFFHFALAALVYVLFPKNINNISNAVKDKTASVLLWGLLGTFFALPLALLLTVTIIGIPLVLIEIALLFVAWIMGYAGITLLAGSKIREALSIGEGSPLGEIALGVIILGIIRFIPLLGFLTGIAVFILALGASLATRIGSAGGEKA